MKKNSNTGETKETRRVNKAVEALFKALDRFVCTCESNGSPIRSVSFSEDKDGHRKTTIRYRRK